MIQTKDFCNSSDIFSVGKKRWTIWIKGRHTRSKLAAILNIEQHAWQKP
jgi:hypothetical protein